LKISRENGIENEERKLKMKKVGKKNIRAESEIEREKFIIINNKERWERKAYY